MSKQGFWGYVLEDKAKDTDQVKVLPVEDLPGAVDGTVAPGTTSSSVSTKDSSGTTTTANVTTTNFITATFLGDTNKPYPPMVVAGEKVWVYQLFAADKYYWSAAGRDQSLRGLDRYRIEVSGLDHKVKGNANVQKTDLNTYFIDFDSITGAITIGTSAANGEKASWRFRFDGAKGIATWTDAKKDPNTIIIDSVNDKIQILNGQLSSVTLNKKNVEIYAPEDVIIRADRQFILNTPAITVNTEDSKWARTANMVINVGYLAVNSADSTVVTAKCIGINGNLKTTGAASFTSVRYQSMCEGAIGAGYNPTKIDYRSGQPASVGNSPDTDMSGTGNRHACAVEDAVKAAVACDAAFSAITSKIGAPGGTNIASIMGGGKMNDLKSV